MAVDPSWDKAVRRYRERQAKRDGVTPPGPVSRPPVTAPRDAGVTPASSSNVTGCDAVVTPPRARARVDSRSTIESASPARGVTRFEKLALGEKNEGRKQDSASPAPAQRGSGLTSTDKKVLLGIARLGRTTFRELGEAVGLRSTSTVFTHVTRLRRRRLVSWEPGRNRTLMLAPGLVLRLDGEPAGWLEPV